MSILICGSRTLKGTDYPELEKQLDDLVKNETTVVHGGAEGADMLVELWCRRHQVRTIIVRPDYCKYPPHIAPLKRNEEMVRMTTRTIAIIRGKMTNGTKHTIDYTRKWRQPVIIANLQTHSREEQTELPME